MQFMKLLWPTDFSKNAEYALPYVTSLSEKYQTEVHVLYVIDELGYHDPWYGEFDRSRIDKIHEWEKEKAEERLTKICDKYLQKCPLYIKHIAIGDPAREIENPGQMFFVPLCFPEWDSNSSSPVQGLREEQTEDFRRDQTK
jgi:nucleotide-binding universal stress UspA family protein